MELFYDAASYMLNLLALHAATQPSVPQPRKVGAHATAATDP